LGARAGRLTGQTEKPSRQPLETRRAEKSSPPDQGEKASVLALFNWREAGIRAYAHPRDRAALLAALRNDRRTALQAVKAKARRRKEAEQKKRQQLSQEGIERRAAAGVCRPVALPRAGARAFVQAG
jgi:hypothetical protein